MTIRTLTLASLKMFVRNKQSLFFTLFMPFIFIGIFGLVGFDKPQTIDVGIVTNAPSTSTKGFLDSLNTISALKIYNGNDADERTALQKGDRAVVLIVPDDLFPDPAAKTAPITKDVTILKNVAYEQQAQTAIVILTQLFDKTTLQIAKAPTLFALNVQDINAKKVRYIDFLLPGIVAMSIMQMAVFSVAFVFTDYKEKGILKRLLATPMKPQDFVISQVITRLLVAVTQSAVLLGFGALVFKSHIDGNPLLILLTIMLGGIMFLGLGFTISGLSKTVDAVPALANLIVFPMLFLSGIFFPTSSMPGWLQSVVVYLPLQPFAKAMRAIIGDGAGFSAIKGDLAWVAGWAIVLVFLAVITFRWEEKRM
ncbi:MAG: ABC transporter permease [Patescibacteria group bacterium]